VVDDGPLDIVLVHGWVQSFDGAWEVEPIERSIAGSRRSPA